MKIPSNNLWTQTNEGKKLGILSESFNLNLETPGQMQGAKKAVAHLHEDQHTQMGYVLAVVYYNNDYIALTTNEAYTFALNTNTASTTSQPSATNASDAVICFNRVYLSLYNNLAYYDGSSWTTGIEPLTAGVPHPMDVFDSLPTFKLAIGDSNTVILVDSSGNKDSTVLTLPAQFQVITLRYRNGFLYIGTRNIYGGEARVFIWNGSGTNAQYEVPTGASWVFSMVPYRSSVACVTDRGQLLYINGSSAEELASFPVAYVQNAKWQDHLGLQLNGKVFNRGMAVVDDSIYINIDGEVDIGECLEMKSGIWVFNPEVGLYHMAQASSDRTRVGAFTISSSEITTAADHYLKTGDGVLFTTAPTGADSNRTYYAYVTGTNKLKIAKSRKALQAGEHMTISGTGGIMYAQNRDQGIRHHSSGAIGRIVTQEFTPELFAGEIMFGALVENLDGTNKYTLQILTDSYNVSRFSTQRIYSDNVEQNWQHAYTFIDGMTLDNEKVIVKEQTRSEELRRPIVGTWLDTNTINVETTGSYDTYPISEGDELVITDGYGRGYSAFVVSKESSTNVTSITIDEDLGTINTSVTFYTTPAKKVGEITSEEIKKGYFKSNLLDGSSPWVVLKGEMRGFQTDVSHIELSNKIHTSAN